MKRFSRFLMILIGFNTLLLAGCHRLATSPTIDLSQFTPGVEETTSNLGGESTPIFLSEIKTTPSQEVTLSPATQRTLSLFPLRIGSSWVYHYLGFDETTEVTWRVVETVVNTGIVDGFYVAELERSAEVIRGEPGENFISEPFTGVFWYLIDGDKVYQFDPLLSTDLSEAWLELILPFPKGEDGWYPNPVARAELEPGFIGFRSASEPFDEVLPWGDTYTCYNVVTHLDTDIMESLFCDQVGYVFEEVIYFNTSSGHRFELQAFSLQ